MTPTPVSVVIVSRNRPDDLRKSLRALEFQTHRPFEVVVVGDTAPPDRAPAKYLPIDVPNISAARNLGIERAAGEIIAFIDDDAIAEPTWLERLVEPLKDPDVAASGGFVRGRNGISFQWKAQNIDRDGYSHDLAVDRLRVFHADEGRVIKLQGTSCAIRRETLIALGGFDEAFRFYLDEADLCMRLSEDGCTVAVVPKAEVQHGFAASAFRGADRRPLSLYEIAASQALFRKKYSKFAELEPFFREQERRLDAALLRGTLEPRDVRRLRKELSSGYAEGRSRAPALRTEWQDTWPFQPYIEDAACKHRFLSTNRSNRADVFESARRLSAEGAPVTVLDFSLTSLFHRRWFHRDGFWVQSGGLFGKSTRYDPLFSWYSREERVERESAMLRETRF